ncbi:GNAT family N-acetyltransferase [Kibdelosporangium lantanae]|uniref:GNAT family N-acetyltransferase n=1 Tax=Kibdelosporangium lantanae TaxID=1497396 RepID=A0ABW3MAY3_9PSEU
MSDISVVQNENANRYEVRVDGKVAGFTEYVVEGDDYVFVHTEVDDAYAGQGLATRLATGALDDVVANGRTIVPVCPFIAKFVLRHKDTYEPHVKWPR